VQKDWLAATSFERRHDLLSAISTLSIHSKLVLADVSDPAASQDIEGARKTLVDFLDGFAPLVDQLQSEAGQPIVGTDPDLTDLVYRFISVWRDRVSSGSVGSPKEMAALLARGDDVDHQKVVAWLDLLRSVTDEPREDSMRLLSEGFR
jgi:hypothetical protein